MTIGGTIHSDGDLIQLATEKLSRVLSGWHTPEQLQKGKPELSVKLSCFSPAALREIIRETDHSTLMYLTDCISSRWETEEFIRDLIAFAPIITNSEELGFPGKRDFYLRGISHYEFIETQGTGSYPPRRLAQGAAVLRVTEHFRSQGIKSKVFRSFTDTKSSYAIIMESGIRTVLIMSDDPEATATTIIDRNLTTYDEVLSFLATTSTLEAPLREGVL